MQRFTLLHDGSVQGWQATYLAFHVAARLGSPLQVLHIDPNNDDHALHQRSMHVKTGGNAAGVVVENHLVSDFSLNTLKEHITAIDGFFLPQHLIADRESVSLYLDAFSRPLWAASVDAKLDEMALLVHNPIQNADLIVYAKTLSQRLQQSVIAFIVEDKLESILKPELSDIRWMLLPTFSQADIAQALKQLQVDLLFVSEADALMAGGLPANCVIFPTKQDA